MTLPLLRAYQNDDADSVRQLGAAVAGWRDADEMRLVAGAPLVAHLHIINRATTIMRREGVCDLFLTVQSDHRRQGVGSALYARALTFALERGARTLRTWFSGTAADAIAFFGNRGWTEAGRDIGSRLDLTLWDSMLFASAGARMQSQNIHVFAYADIADTEAHRRSVYALELAARRRMDWDDDPPQTQPSFEYWQEDFAGLDRRFVTLAEADGQWIGMHSGGDWGFTGVHPDWRGRGIALALKAKSLAIQQASGRESVVTENEARNAPMLAVNRKLGFVFDTPSLMYEKRLP